MIPEVLRIGHASYELKRDDARCEIDEVEAISSGNHCSILYRGDRPHDQLCNTLLHEVMHQCLYVAGLTRVLIDTELGGMEAEEFIVTSLGGTLLGALRDNPDFTDFILS